jgi:hypothetical protein
MLWLVLIGVLHGSCASSTLAMRTSLPNCSSLLSTTFHTHCAITITHRYYPLYEQEAFFKGLDVVVFSVSILSFEEVSACPQHSCSIKRSVLYSASV